MIIDLIVQFFVGLVTWIIGLFPSLPDSGWLSGSVASTLATISSKAGQLSFWVPFGALGTVIQLVLAAIVVAVGIKTIRIIASFFLAGGGSAG